MKILTLSIAGYNVEKYIRQTLDSICCKNISKLEVFVVDDGGNDKTLDIAKEYSAKYPGCIIPVHKENGGWGSTVNYSIAHATGKYFKLLDGDDLFTTENLDKFIECLESVDADVIYTPYFRFDDESGKRLKDFNISDQFNKNIAYGLRETEIEKGLEMHALSFRTAVLQDNNVRVLEKCFYTDNEYRMKGLAYSQSIIFTNIELYNYRVGREGQSVDITGLKKHYLDAIRVSKEMMSFYKANETLTFDYIIKCVKNSIDFVYWTLIALNKKDELREYDNYIKQKGNLFYDTHIIPFKILRALNFNGLGLVRYLIEKISIIKKSI